MLERVCTPRRVMSLEPQIRNLCRRPLDRLAGKDRFDLVTAFANEVLMRVIGTLAGIPEAHQEAVRDKAARCAPNPGMQISGQANPDAEHRFPT